MLVFQALQEQHGFYTYITNHIKGEKLTVNGGARYFFSCWGCLRAVLFIVVAMEFVVNTLVNKAMRECVTFENWFQALYVYYKH